MKILNFGSLNIDHVYRVGHICRPGETIPSSAYQVFAGGKGANQSAALALAGAQVFHAGQVGPEGQWLIAKLAGLGVDMRFTRTAAEPTGHAIIQVDTGGQNSIVLYPGANHTIPRAAVQEVISHFNPMDILLLQNEINDIPYIMEKGRERGMRLCFNPAPFSSQVTSYPIELIDIVVVNETEGTGLTGSDSTDNLIGQLTAKWPGATFLLTLGEKGARYCSPAETIEVPAVPVQPVDTTAAGDTFIGYFLAGLAADLKPSAALQRAARAPPLCVTRHGAMDSIPAAGELDLSV
jgi:ribokinase